MKDIGIRICANGDGKVDISVFVPQEMTVKKNGGNDCETDDYEEDDEGFLYDNLD